jgi:hypothetical protein
LNLERSVFNFDASRPEILGDPEFGESKDTWVVIPMYGENQNYSKDPSNPIQETLNQTSLQQCCEDLTYLYLPLPKSDI